MSYILTIITKLKVQQDISVHASLCISKLDEHVTLLILRSSPMLACTTLENWSDGLNRISIGRDSLHRRKLCAV